MKLLKSVAIILSLSVSAHAVQLNPQARLRKMSEILRQGKSPSTGEYAALTQALGEGNAEAFFKRKASEYTTSEEFKNQLLYNLNELLWLRTDNQTNGALSETLKTVAYQNLDWNLLLTTKNYSLSSSEWGFYSALNTFPSDRVGTSQFGYFQGTVLNPISSTSQTTEPFSFPESEDRISGILTTKTFAERYRNTELNKGRTRAAFVFRTFLCDSMRPIVVKNEDAKRAVLKKYFDRVTNSGITIETIEEHTKKDPHGTQEACMKCHYKLDPVGRMFANMVHAVPKTTVPGKLRFQSKEGEKVDVPVQNLGELGRAITSQRDYLACQTEHFWRWYIGDKSDVEISPERRSDLISKFNELGRRPSDFAAYLVNLPEFYTKAPELPKLPSAIVAITRNCNDCHDMHGADLTRLPFGPSQEEHERFLGKMVKMLDLKNDGSNPAIPRNAQMPPDWAGFSLSEGEYLTIRNWIGAGAPDSKGRATIPGEKASELLGGSK